MKLAFLLLFCAVSTAESAKEAVSLAKLPKVPKVQNAGADGFPSLPEVGSMLGDFSQTLKGINSQASSLEAQLQKVQAESQTKMKNEKAVFDKRLKDQELENLKIQGENSVLAKKMVLLHQGNDGLLLKIKQVQKVNKFRRSELLLLENQFDRAHKAAEDAIAATDDSQASQLAVLSSKGLDAKVDESSSNGHEGKKETSSSEKDDVGQADGKEEASSSENDDMVKAEGKEEASSSEKDDVGKAEAAADVTDVDEEGPSIGGLSFLATKKSSAKVKVRRQSARSRSRARKKRQAPNQPQLEAKPVADEDKAVPVLAEAKDMEVQLDEQDVATQEATEKDLEKKQTHKQDSDPQEEAAPVDAEDDSGVPEQPEESKAASEHLASSEERIGLPESLVNMLSQGLKSMREQADKSEAKLKALFEKSYKAGAKRHEALVLQAKALQKSYAGMKQLEGKLKAAYEHLQATQSTLQQRILNMGSFLGRLEKVALAPIDKVKPALEAAKAWKDHEGGGEDVDSAENWQADAGAQFLH